MIDEAIVIYCVVDEVVKLLNYQDDIQCKMSTSEVITFAVLAGLYHFGDYMRSRTISQHLHLFSGLLSHSQLVRRIHKVPEQLWHSVFEALRSLLSMNKTDTYIVDSMPVKAYGNHKSFRAKIFKGKQFHGYSASRKEYFFGLKLHLMIDENLVPVEFSLKPASCSDIGTFQEFNINIKSGSVVLGDKAYTSYQFEEYLESQYGIRLLVKRRRNLKRQNTIDEELILSKRNKIETVLSGIASRMPRTIRANTEKGFSLKIVIFILAYMLSMFSRHI